MKSKFERFWLDEVKSVKLGHDGLNHNKLRTYSLLKGSFGQEPYISLIRNRNQRSFLTRLRTSSHHLAVETGRFKRPITPLNDRVCVFCQYQSNAGCFEKSIDDEFHFLMDCPTFELKRNCLFGKMTSISPKFEGLSKMDKFLTLLCPTTPQTTKITNKFIKILFESRQKLTDGCNIDELGYPQFNLDDSLSD